MDSHCPLSFGRCLLVVDNEAAPFGDANGHIILHPDSIGCAEIVEQLLAHIGGDSNLCSGAIGKAPFLAPDGTVNVSPCAFAVLIAAHIITGSPFDAEVCVGEKAHMLLVLALPRRITS